MSTAALPKVEMTVAELAARVGDIPYWRIHTDPPPGEATEEDIERIRREKGVPCELIDGVLVEKAVSYYSGLIAAELTRLLGNFVSSRRLGWINGSDGFVWILGKFLRAPDVQFVHRDQFPDGRPPTTGYPELAPALVVEVFSPGNTPGEMELKRRHFFEAGTELFWIVYPDRQEFWGLGKYGQGGVIVVDPHVQEIDVFTDPETHQTLGRDEILDGGDILPGFSIRVGDLFDAVDMNCD
jgi:Uma2 family endonuclease